MSDAKTILVVDDDPDAVTVAEAVLSELDGVTVVSANHGAAGLEKARTCRPDLIILDVQMPGMSGFEVFTELKRDAATKGIRVIMLTGVAEQTGIKFSGADMGSFLGQEPDAYIEKPCDPPEMLKLVRKLLGLPAA